MDLAAERSVKKPSPTIVDEAETSKSTPVVAIPEEGVVVEWRADGSVLAGASKRNSKKNERESKRRRRVRDKIDDILGECWVPPCGFLPLLSGERVSYVELPLQESI